jgi:hypothetical protein
VVLLRSFVLSVAGPIEARKSERPSGIGEEKLLIDGTFTSKES